MYDVAGNLASQQNLQQHISWPVLCATIYQFTQYTRIPAVIQVYHHGQIYTFMVVIYIQGIFQNVLFS